MDNHSMNAGTGSAKPVPAKSGSENDASYARDECRSVRPQIMVRFPTDMAESSRACCGYTRIIHPRAGLRPCVNAATPGPQEHFTERKNERERERNGCAGTGCSLCSLCILGC